MSEDDFMSIINNNNLEEHMINAEALTTNIPDLLAGIRALNETSALLADFVESFMLAIEEGLDPEERPGLTLESVVFVNEAFKNARKFSEIYLEDDDEDDDEDEESEEEDGDESDE